MIEYETFSAPYGVCGECQWETDYGMSEQDIHDAMRRHYIDRHNYTEDDHREPQEDEEN